MVKSMVDRKIPIDGVGLQMHVKLDPEKGGPPDEARVRSNGLPIVCTCPAIDRSLSLSLSLS